LIFKSTPVTEMKHLAYLLVILSLAACVGSGDPQGPEEPLNPVSRAVAKKPPHGYVTGGDPSRFGGFIGDCASDENFPHYWECQSENSGNNFH
jgi:hypothetical protein